MSRLLKIRKPNKHELRKLHLIMEAKLATGQFRRAEAIILYAGGLHATEIAKLLEVHVNTIYHDLREFDKKGLKSIEQTTKLGAPAHISDKQVDEIVKLAKQVPAEIGLPYGRWSLSKLQAYLLKKKIVKQISCRHLARLLKKRDCTFAKLNANSLAMILNAQRSSIE